MHTKLNYTETAALFSNIAAKHKEITYFVEVDIQDIKSVVVTKDYAMLYTGFKESLSGSKSDNNQSSKRCFFAIVQYRGTKSPVVTSPHDIIDACRLIALDVITWLRNEKRNNRLNGFDQDSVDDGQEIIMKDDGFYGWEFSLIITTPVNLAFNADKWNE